jgi:hypothetical protein
MIGVIGTVVLLPIALIALAIGAIRFAGAAVGALAAAAVSRPSPAR